jgi:hypothetical protein
VPMTGTAPVDRRHRRRQETIERQETVESVTGASTSTLPDVVATWVAHHGGPGVPDLRAAAPG